MRYIIDLPDADGVWKEIASFDTEEEAVKFVQGHFGADEDGKVSLISEVFDCENDVKDLSED